MPVALVGVLGVAMVPLPPLVLDLLLSVDSASRRCCS